MGKFTGKFGGAAALGALVTLAVFAAFVAFVSFSSTRGNVPNAGETPGYDPAAWQQSAQSSEGVPSVPEEEDTSADRDSQKGPVVPPATRVLAAADSSTAYRALSGPCPDMNVVVESTTDGGDTWSPSRVGGNASSAQRLLAGEDGYAVVFAADADNCDSVVAASSGDYGGQWNGASETLDASWYADGGDPRIIHSPGGAQVEAPCDVARFAPADSDHVGLVCQSGALYSTADGGQNWSEAAKISGIDALTATGDGFVAAAVGDNNCQGVELFELNLALETTNSFCEENFRAAPGEVALASGGQGVLWLWAGAELQVSLDNGRSWGGQ